MIRLVALLVCLASAGVAQEGARAGVTGATADAGWRSTDLSVTLDAAVPWRVFLEGDPQRLVLDTSEVDWAMLDAASLADIGPVLSGRIRPGWSRLALALPEAMRIGRAWMETGVGATIHIELIHGAGAEAPLAPAEWQAAPEPRLTMARPRQDGNRPLVVALDPGHGGIDSGAERGGTTEAVLMLRFAQELAEVLRRAGHTVVLTRETDEFVGLRGRTSIARAAGADLMISLHADAIADGEAEGATVYTLSADGGEALAAEIAQRHGRDDLLLGVTLDDPGDEIARVLVDLARTETQPRSARLADALVAGLGQAGVRLHKRPRLGGRFTVLKAPDIPSVLLELGFMSDAQDLANLTSPDWRARMAAAIARGLAVWATADAGAAALLRR